MYRDENELDVKSAFEAARAERQAEETRERLEWAQAQVVVQPLRTYLLGRGLESTVYVQGDGQVALRVDAQTTGWYLNNVRQWQFYCVGTSPRRVTHESVRALVESPRFVGEIDEMVDWRRRENDRNTRIAQQARLLFVRLVVVATLVGLAAGLAAFVS